MLQLRCSLDPDAGAMATAELTITLPRPLEWQREVMRARAGFASWRAVAGPGKSTLGTRTD